MNSVFLSSEPRVLCCSPSLAAPPFNAAHRRDHRFELTAIYPLLLALVGMIEHAKCLEKSRSSSAVSRLEVPPVQPRALLRAAFREASDAASLTEGGPSREHGHGHSHGGVQCHGHGHGGHSSSGAAAQAAPSSHGHSHGGVPCDGHGHGHGHGGAVEVPRSELDLSHPWGSAMRAFLSVLPAPSELHVALYYTPAHFKALRGTPLFHDVSQFIRHAGELRQRAALVARIFYRAHVQLHAVKSYLGYYNLFGEGGLEVIAGFAPCERRLHTSC